MLTLVSDWENWRLSIPLEVQNSPAIPRVRLQGRGASGLGVRWEGREGWGWAAHPPALSVRIHLYAQRVDGGVHDRPGAAPGPPRGGCRSGQAVCTRRPGPRCRPESLAPGRTCLKSKAATVEATLRPTLCCPGVVRGFPWGQEAGSRYRGLPLTRSFPAGPQHSHPEKEAWADFKIPSSPGSEMPPACPTVSRTEPSPRMITQSLPPAAHRHMVLIFYQDMSS